MFAASKSGSVSEPTDNKFNYVTMLLHGNGSNGSQNNTFLDSSTNNFTITRNGNTTQGTFSPYGSNWSNYFDGSGDTLNTASNAAFGFGSGAWTFEAWVYPTTSQTDNWIIATNDSGKLRMRVGSSGYLSFFTDTGSVSLNSTTVVTVNAWSHVAICYDGTTLSLFQNGTRTATSTVSISNGSANSCYIGSNTVGGGYWNGYISNARVVKGSAVYSGATYTVPTTPLTAISGTSLLTCADNRFIDDSTNNFTITKNGDVSVQRFSPFSPTTAYSTSVIGGSGYFDGSGDYLTIPSGAAPTGSGAFTVDFWYYFTATQTFTRIFGGGANTFNLGISSNGNLYYGKSNVANVADGTFLPTGIGFWAHVVVGKNSSNTYRIWVNGVSQSTGTDSYSYDSATNYVGASSSATFPLSGYLSNLRVTNTDVYGTSNTTITVPTAPLTAVSGTQLLLSTTNAGILDNAMMNDLETVGNAQISTSVKKYGTGSLAFDGTGDYLQTVDTPNIELGGGNFTLEAWIYPTSLTSGNFILSKQTNVSTASGYAFRVLDSTSGGNASKLAFYASSNGSTWDIVAITATTALSTNTWYHVAVTRSGSSFTIWLNGVSDGTGTSSTAIQDNTNPLCIGAAPGGGGTYTGYIDDLRITKGVARYTATFTAPTAPFPDKG
jgi:hypothetical protein